MRRFLLPLSIALMIAVSYALIHLGGLRDERHAIAREPGARTVTECNGVAMTREECRLEAARHQLNAVDYWYFSLSNFVQWVIVYGIIGTSGAVAAYWLRLAGIGGARTDEFSLPRILAATVAGVMTALLLKLPGPLVARYVAPELKDLAGQELHSLYGSCVALAFMAGLFVSIFFRKLRSNFGKHTGGVSP